MTNEVPKFMRGDHKSEKTESNERIERTVDSFRIGQSGAEATNDNTVRPRSPGNDDFESASSALSPRAINAVTEPWGGGLEPFVTEADSHRHNKYFIGSRVKIDHKSGDFVKPQTGEAIDITNPFKPISARRSWILFDDNSDAILDRIDEESGNPLPKKSGLPAAEDGTTWKLSVYLVLTDPDIEAPFTFYSSAGGAYDAVQELLQRIKASRRRHPTGFPLVQMATIYQKFRTGSRGFWSPTFTLVEWQQPDGSRTAI